MNNFFLRTITGIAFVALLVSAIIYNPISFGVLFAVVSGLATLEFCNIMNKQNGVRINTFMCTIASIMMFLGFFAYNSGIVMSVAVFLPYLVILLYLLIAPLYYDRNKALASWAYTMMSQIYVALPFALLNVMTFIPYPSETFAVEYANMYPLAIFIFLWSSDSGAYCVGSLLGRKIPYKLFPSISPKKSWVGSVGGTLLAIGAGVFISLNNIEFAIGDRLFRLYDHSLTLLQWMGFGLIVAVFGTWGDLVESQIKRQLGIKDSGNILPGHGGMLDRFDSCLLAIPASLVYLYSLWCM